MSPDDADLNALFGSDDEDGDLVSKPAVGDGTYIDQSGPEEQHRHLAQFRAEEEEPEEEEEEEQDAGPGPEDDAPEEPVESIRVDLPLRPKLPSERLSVVKLSNIVDIEKKPFDRDTFEPADETYLDDQGTRRLRPSGEGVIRWRTEAIDDELKYESNARIVQWSDGSMQLVLGEEILDISVQDITSQNQMLYLRMGGVLQGQAMLRTKLNFQPSSLESKLHRRLAAAVDRRYTKASRVRTITKQMDPELERARREKQEEMSIKEREQRRAKQRRAMDRAYSQARASRPPPRPHFSRGPLMTAGYLEDDGYDEDYLAGGEVADVATDGRFGGGSRFVDEGEEAERERRLTMAKRGGGGRGFEDGSGGKRPRLHDSEDDQQDGVQLSDDDEDEDEDLGAAAAAPPDPPPRPTPAAGRRAVIMDDDDDD